MFPFGVQLKGFLVGLIFAYFVVPFLQRMWINKIARNTNG
jgi:hypothetical protein